MRRVAAILALILAAAPAIAQEYRVVTDRATFVQLIEGRDLTRFGVRLTVNQGGSINGSAFGRKVTGTWSWQGQYFCREMAFGATAIEADCQQVLLRDDTLRFVAERGKGDSADLRLR